MKKTFILSFATFLLINGSFILAMEEEPYTAEDKEKLLIQANALFLQKEQAKSEELAAKKRDNKKKAQNLANLGFGLQPTLSPEEKKAKKKAKEKKAINATKSLKYFGI